MSAWRSFWRGFARAFDIHPARRPVRPPGMTGREADKRAIASDWRAVGDDVRTAAGKTRRRQ